LASLQLATDRWAALPLGIQDSRDHVNRGPIEVFDQPARFTPHRTDATTSAMAGASFGWRPNSQASI
jgi:hypothetical protein